MPIRKPALEDTLQFVAQTHDVENLPCNYMETSDTVLAQKDKTKRINLFADGHLRALSYAQNKLVDTTDFPAKDPKILTNKYKSDECLFWLKELHKLAFSPIIKHPIESVKPDGPKLHHMGTWRTEVAHNLLGLAPAPAIIPAIMHNWLLELAKLHHLIKDKLDNPHGIDKITYRKMALLIKDQPLFFSCVQPFPYANNRFGRLIENVIRIAWRQPLRFMIGSGYENFKADLEPYQAEKLPAIIEQAKLVRG
jgi:hypothetical protein